MRWQSIPVVFLVIGSILCGYGLGLWYNSSQQTIQQSGEPRSENAHNNGSALVVPRWEASQSALPTPLVAASASPFPPQALKPTRILLGGDMMWDRSIRQVMRNKGNEFILAELTSFFQEFDVVVANLEGPITEFDSKSVGSQIGTPANYIFTFSPDILPMLVKNKIHIVNIGNNHIGNFGVKGIEQTKNFLVQHSINYFGFSGQEQQPDQRVSMYSKEQSVSVAFVGYNEFVPGGWEAALADVAYATTAADVVIVMPHWGAEYQTVATGSIVSKAHQLIDAGADLVVGAHPHVVQQMEEYRGKRIYYSLGNFVFDQYFQPEVQRGLLLEVLIYADGTFEFIQHPIRLKQNGQTVRESL